MKLQISLKDFAKDTLYFTGGGILNALGIYTFAKNASFAPGGVSGLALMVNHATGWPIGVLTLIFNIPLVVLGLRMLGLSFMVKSMYTMVICTLLLDVVFPFFPAYSGNPLLAAAFTGVLVGAGLALVYMRGSSTGGADFLLMAIKKMRPHFSVGQISLVLDGVVILLGGFVFGNVDAVLYGIISSFACTLMMDELLYGAGSGKLAIIITNKGDEIARAISAEVGRGSTLVRGTGTYTGQEREMLYCACSKNEIYKVRTAAHAVDPDALMMVTEASEVIGEGFIPPPLPGNEAPPRAPEKDPHKNDDPPV